MRKLIMLLALAAALTGLPGTAGAANGDNLRTIIADRTGTDCASVNAAGGHASVGVGIAFDGTNLLISCYSDNTVTAINPADGSQVAVHNIVGATSLGALAWDNGRGLLWACSAYNTVGTIDLATNVYTPAFTIAGTGVLDKGCFDGLAYDAADDTIWASGDISETVEHFTITGTELSSTNVGLGDCNGGFASSGIAVGGPLLSWPTTAAPRSTRHRRTSARRRCSPPSPLASRTWSATTSRSPASARSGRSTRTTTS
jgi:hypothetical protein